MISLVKNKIILTNVSDLDLSVRNVAVFNTEAAYFYYKSDYYDYLKLCDAIAIDGAFLKLAFLLRGFSVTRYHGPDLLDDALRVSSAKKIIVGGADSNVKLVNESIVDNYVPLPFSDDINLLVDHFIRNFDFLTDNRYFLFISLGLPKQERFSFLLRHKLETIYSDTSNIVLVPLGAAVDFQTGAKIRSGIFWQKLGLEWLPRLIREPRMLVRNVRSLYAFLMVLIKG